MSAEAEILLVEDEPAIREGLAVLLESEGYVVRAAENGARALELFRARRPALVLLDVMMPRKNGYVVCEEIRAADRDVPIVFLTAKDGETDELRGLTMGADDYISKTASHPVLLARLSAVLNRSRRAEALSSGDFDFAGWRVDVARFRLMAPGRESVDLALREIEILRHFHLHPGEVVSRDFLLTRFWGMDYAGNEASLSVAISRLREKLGADGARIERVYGQGYRYSCPQGSLSPH